MWVVVTAAHGFSALRESSSRLMSRPGVYSAVKQPPPPLVSLIRKLRVALCPSQQSGRARWRPRVSPALVSRKPSGPGCAANLQARTAACRLPHRPLAITEGLRRLALQLFKLYFLSLSLGRPLLQLQVKLLRTSLTHQAAAKTSCSPCRLPNGQPPCAGSGQAGPRPGRGRVSLTPVTASPDAPHCCLGVLRGPELFPVLPCQHAWFLHLSDHRPWVGGGDSVMRLSPGAPLPENNS